MSVRQALRLLDKVYCAAVITKAIQPSYCA